MLLSDCMMEQKRSDMDHPILFYDGDCGLCNFAVRFILTYEKEAIVRFAALQSDVASRMLPLEWRKNLDAVILRKNGRLYVKSNALIQIATYLKFPLCLLRLLRCIPRPVRDWLYDRVAKNRQRLLKAYCLRVDEITARRFMNH